MLVGSGKLRFQVISRYIPRLIRTLGIRYPMRRSIAVGFWMSGLRITVGSSSSMVSFIFSDLLNNSCNAATKLLKSTARRVALNKGCSARCQAKLGGCMQGRGAESQLCIILLREAFAKTRLAAKQTTIYF